MGKELGLDYDNIMKCSIVLLKSCGAHPDIPRDFQWYVKFGVMKIIYTYHMYLLIYGILAIGDFKNNIIDTCSIATLLVIHVVINFKFWVLNNYQKIFKILIEDVKKFYIEAETLPKAEKDVVLKFALEGGDVSKYWLLICTLASIIFLVQPFILMLYHFVRGQFKYVQIIDMQYPSYLSQFSDGTLFWEVYPIWIFFFYYSACMYVGLVPLGPSLILHACGRLELLRGRTMKLFVDDGEVTTEERTKRLRAIAIELQAIYDFVDNVKVALKLLYELTLKATSIILPVTVYVLIEAFAQGQIRTEFLTLLLGGLSICSMPCYYGEKLIEKSSELRDAVYMSGWEDFYDRKTRSTLIILMTRMERAVGIRTVFVTICMETLTDVINQAYMIFSLLHAAWG